MESLGFQGQMGVEGTSICSRVVTVWLVLQLQSCTAFEWPAPTPFFSQNLSLSVCDSAKWVRDLPRTQVWYWWAHRLYPRHLLHLFCFQEAILPGLVTSKVLPFNRREAIWASPWSTHTSFWKKVSLYQAPSLGYGHLRVPFFPPSRVSQLVFLCSPHN